MHKEINVGIFEFVLQFLNVFDIPFRGARNLFSCAFPIILIDYNIIILIESYYVCDFDFILLRLSVAKYGIISMKRRKMQQVLKCN